MHDEHLDQTTGQQSIPQVKLLVTIREAAFALSLGRTYLYRLLATGQIFSIKLGARRLIPVAALQEFVDRLSEFERAG
jgi:excisionase family DNA binding protein